MVALSEMTRSLRLLVVDMQKPFLDSIHNPENLIRRVSFAMEACKLFKIGISVTEQTPEKLGPTFPSIHAWIDPEQIFSKVSFSALQAPGLTVQIKKTETKHLLVAGLETPICIYQTVLDALAQDWEVTVLSDCISCRRQEDAAPIFQTLRNTGCHLLPSETIFYSLLGSADHPVFSQFNQLVKKYG